MTQNSTAVPFPEGLPIPVAWSDDRRSLRLLDQTLLPEEERYLVMHSVADVAEAIRSLRVRGAPAIGIAAAMGLAVAARRRAEDGGDRDPEAFATALEGDARILRETRPTAVNLGWALDRMAVALKRSRGEGTERMVEVLAREAATLAEEDRAMGYRIGAFGGELIPPEGAGVLTHCNAGVLATGGVGTALAPVYGAHARNVPVHLFADETRPLLQGARLTAWEATRAGVPVTVITDSMAASLMAQGAIDLVLVGADRVAANGDVANKIGTYGVAVLARHHGIPFFVALPRSTFDPSTGTGREIPIEKRDRSEVALLGDRVLVPEGVPVRNEAFDITPAHLVTGFVTDGGVLRPPFGPAIRALLDLDPDHPALPSNPTEDLS